MKTFLGRETRKDGSFCNLILTPKGVCRYQKCSKNCCFSWFLELFQAVKCFEGKYRPSNSIVILPYILKTSQKNFGVVTMKTLRGRRKKRTPPLESGLLESEPLFFETQFVFFFVVVGISDTSEQKFKKNTKYNGFRVKCTSYEGTKMLMCKNYDVKINKRRKN